MKLLSPTLSANTFYTVKLFIIILCVAFLGSCKKNKQDDLIPNVPVNITIFLSLPEYSALNSIGNYAIIPGGYKGIIVYRRSLEEFVSFDQACPYDPTTTGALLEIDSSGVTTIDHKCGSKFNLYDGSVLHGPATRSMKPYQTVYEPGNNSVSISN